MQAKVTVAFSGVPDGEVHPRKFEPGDTVDGELAGIALDQGWAEPIKGATRGAAPEPDPEPEDEQRGPHGRKGRRA